MYTYQLNCDQYVLCQDGQPILRPLDEVAIVVSRDAETGDVTLHKHGEPDRIDDWFKSTRARLASTGPTGVAMAEEMKLVRGRFNIDALNLAINRSQSALRQLAFPPLVIDVDCVEIRG